ncbi:MAG: hypothetical protein KKB51_16565 [Candidatus Riflebacteria bacterium]|nr:hypothetical protein [Candidatus Riflebacteria bacterium]
MNENIEQSLETKDLGNAARNVSRRHQSLVSWVVMLSSVFLFGSSLNCVFIWLAYGRGYDAAALALSLVLALIVYFFALDSKRTASYSRRLLIATSALMAWAVLLPIVMKLTGFKSF